MADFLSLIGTVLNSRQRAADAAREARQFNQDLAFRGNESRLSRDARASEIANQIALDRERMAQEEELRRAALAQEQSQFGDRLGFDYSRLGQEGSQFGANLTQRQTEAQRDYEAQLAQQQLAREAGTRQEQQMLAALADRFDSPDILNLLGGQLGVPGLGSRTYQTTQIPGSVAARGANRASVSPRFNGAMRWDAISGMIPANEFAWSEYLSRSPSNSASIARRPAASQKEDRMSDAEFRAQMRGY